MKTVIKLTALLLILSIISVPFAYASSDASLPYTEKAITLLEQIGVIQTDDEYDLEHIITRGEMCDILLKLYNAESTKNMVYQSYSFNDIAKNAYAGSIQAAADLGVVSGFGDGSFRPDDTVKYEEAVTALVNVIGYEMLADKNGGYPVGYLTIGNEVKICNDVTGLVGEDITYEKLINLIYKALHTEVLQQVGFGVAKEYKAIEGETLLDVNFDIKTVDGIIDANEITTLTRKAKQPENIVRINGVSYFAGDLDIGDYLGYNVKAYYIEDENDDYEIITYTLNDRKNNIVTVKADDILRTSAQFSYTNFVVEGDKKAIEYEISDEVDVIYNGVAFPGFTLDTLAPATGTVTLIDNNDDYVYDVINVFEFTNYVVNSVNVSDGFVADMYGSMISISPDDYDIVSLKGMWGDDIGIGDLSKWDVLSVALSNDLSVLTATVFNDPVFGVISNIEVDAEGEIITVDGESFRIADSYMAAVTAGNNNAIDLSVGDSGVFYLDMDEKVAAVSLDTSDKWKFGYLIKATETENTMSESLYVKLLAEDALEPEVYNTDEKITIDGTKKSGTDALTDLKTDDAGVVQADSIPQLIRFTTNGKNTINAIDTSVSGRGETAANLSKYTSTGNRWSKWGEFFFSGNNVSFLLDSSTVIFAVPADPANYGNDGLYKIRNTNYLNTYIIGQTNITVDAYGVDFDDDAVAKAIVIRDTSGGGSGAGYDSLTLVTDMKTTFDDDGVEVIKIDGITMAGNAKVKLTVEDPSLVSNISKGDIIAYSDVDGLVYEIHNNGPVFDASAGNTLPGQILFNDGSNAGTAGADHHLFYGIIHQANSNVIKTTMNIPATAGAPVDPTGSSGIYRIGGNLKMIYLCDMSRSDKKITQLSANELQSYVYSMNPNYRVAIHTTTGVLYGIVVYKY